MSLDANTQQATPKESAQPNSLGPAIATPPTAPQSVATTIKPKVKTEVATPETRQKVKTVATPVTTPTPAMPATAATPPTPTPTVPVTPTPTPSSPVTLTKASVAATPTPTAPAPTPNRVSLQEALQSIASTSISRRDMFESSLNAIAKHFGALWGLLELQAGGRTITREYKSRDINTSELVEYAYSLSIDAQMDARSKGKAIPSPQGDYAAIASPIMDPHSDVVFGTMTFFTALESPEKAKRMVIEVERAIAYITALKPHAPPPESQQTSKQKDGELQALLGAAKYDDVTGLCFALVNSYCRKLGCQRTAIGLVEDNQVKLYAISGLETIVENSPAIIGIRQAQEECLDQNRRVIVQQPTTESAAKSDGLLIHRRWHQQASAAAVASFPIQVEDHDSVLWPSDQSHEAFEPFASKSLLRSFLSRDDQAAKEQSRRHLSDCSFVILFAWLDAVSPNGPLHC